MPRVICELPNASDEINGIRFHLLDDGRRISDELDDDQARRFASIPGYSLDEEEREPVKEPEAPPAPKLTKAQQKALEKKQAEEAAAAQAEADDNAGEAEQGTPADEVF